MDRNLLEITPGIEHGEGAKCRLTQGEKMSKAGDDLFFVLAG